MKLELTMDLTMNIFSQIHLQVQIFIFYQLCHGLGMRKILAHGIRAQRIHKPGRSISGFSQVFVEFCRSKVQLVPPHRNEPFQKKKQGVEDMEFPGVLNKYQVDFPGVN